jgi:hypothetical protein
LSSKDVSLRAMGAFASSRQAADEAAPTAEGAGRV